MLRKLSLVAVAAASLGAARWRRPRPRPGAAAFTMAAGMALHRPSRLGRPPRLRRRPGLLRRRIWRLLCAAPGSDPLGSALAAGEPLLLT